MAFFQIEIFVSLLALASPAHIGPNLLQSMNSDPDALHDIFISFNNTEPIAHILSQTGNSRQNRSEVATSVYRALKNNAEVSQRDTINFLVNEQTRLRSVTFESFWISNKLYVQGADEDLIRSLSRRHDVYEIRQEVSFELFGEPPGFETNQSVRANVEWGVKKVRAPEVWASGNTGEGVVVGIIDTGVNAYHEALRDNRVGEYGWYDGVRQRPKPYDNHSHGTHVTGIIAGRGGIGVAPGAKWMMCKGLGLKGIQSSLSRCFQYMACPTHPDGSRRDCSKAPHIVSNSWGSPFGGSTVFEDALRTWHKIGIIPVFAEGNAGPSCGTIGSPADSAQVISVGATTSNDELARFSSIGPTRSRLIKPDVVAPGKNIRSAAPSASNVYKFKSGTSMATPHVAGVLALMRSVNKNAGFSQMKNILVKTASKNLKPRGVTCRGTSDWIFPNNHFGNGLVDAYAAVKAMF